MTNIGGMSKKQIMEENENIYDAVYFNGNRRILTYRSVNITKATLELMSITKQEHTTIGMLLFKEGELKEKLGEKYLSRDINDFLPFI